MKNVNPQIYLDYSATTPLDYRVEKKMRPFYFKDFGNPSSIHFYGQKAANEINACRQTLASYLKCQPNELIFTSGATESNNLAIKGVFNKYKSLYLNKKFHLAISAIEHDAVLEPAKEIENLGAKVDIIPVNKWGLVDLKYISRLIKNGLDMLSIMYVNSEVGIVQPLNQIADLIQQQSAEGQKIIFHTDATQAANLFNLKITDLKVDLLSLSAHKIYGPKGVGLLYCHQKTPISALISGGHQQRNLRSGTLNVPGIVGLTEALVLAQKSQNSEFNRLSNLREKLVAGILKKIDRVKYNCHPKLSSPHIAHFSFLGVEGEAILIALDLAGVAVSTGSACASASLQASHVLLAMGIKQEIAHNSIRFSLGRQTTDQEIDYVLKILPPIIKKLRRYSAGIKI